MERNVEVLVIGGGGIGVCSAHYLNAQNRQVALLDKGVVCSGCSHGNAGLLVPSHSIPLAAPGVVAKALKWMFNPESPFYIKPRLDMGLISWLWRFQRACTMRQVRRSMPVIRDLSLASLRLYRELAGLEGLDFDFVERGRLVVFKTREGLDGAAEEARLLGEVGLEARVVDMEEIGEMEPHVRIDAIGGMVHPLDGHLSPHRFVRQLADYIGQRGVAIHPETEVLGFETAGRQVSRVVTTRGDFAAEHIVLAGGSWTPELSRQLGIRLPIQPAKGYSIAYRRPSPCLALPILLAEAKVGLTPMGDILRIGGALELAGFDRSINRRKLAAILGAVPRYLPDLEPEQMEILEIWRGWRPSSPDGLPFLGRAAAYDNLVVAAGHGPIGISLAPITGRLVGQLVAREKPEIALDALGVERFAG